MSNFTITLADGAPRLCEDGKRLAPVLYGLSDFPAAASNTAYAAKNIAAFARAGVRLVNIDTELQLGWHKVTPFEPDAMLAEVASVTDVNPDAKVLVRLHMNPPYWWLRDHPEECVVYRTKGGDLSGIDDGGHDRLIAHDGDNHMRVSLASELWLDEASEKLSLLCDAFRENPEGEALLGIQVACGLYGEWHKWGSGDDVSEPMKARFRRFLREKYGSNEALAKAWHQPGVTFESAEYRPERFLPGDDGVFLDPRKSQNRIDSRECVQCVPAEDILRFCEVIKSKLPGVLTGAFYGYYLGTGGDHLQVERLYASDKVDFLCGPFCYMENRKADCVPMQRGLLESSRLRGKLWLTEMDQHPVSNPRLGGDPSLKNEAVATLRRNVLQPLLSGHGLWYYDHRVIPSMVAEHPEFKSAASIYRKVGWWEDGCLMDEIAKLERVAERIASRPYRGEADVLLVYDKKSFYYRTSGDAHEYVIHDAVARTGVAYDCIYSDELEVCEIERYKLVIMVNAYMITPENREKYRKILSGTTALWLHAAGFSDGETISCLNISRTVGMEVARKGKNFAIVSDAEIDVLERSEDVEIVTARRGRDVYCTLPTPSGELIKRLVAEVGAHSYCDSGDPILAGGGVVTINAAAGGMRTLRLRSGKVIRLSLPAYSTVAFDSETGERLI